MLGGAVHFALHAHPALANPMGAQVISGGVQIENAGNVLNIHQSTDRAIIHWQDFSIGAGEITNFLQNGGGAAVLNRVTGGNASQLLGTLNANGQVMLLNPNGVFIGQGAVVNVGSFIATTANVADEAFLQGQNLSFVGATEAGIVNQGTIHAHSGDILLMAKTVENSGALKAGEGTAALLAGRDFFLKKDVPGAVKVQVSAGAEGSAAGVGVANSGTIEAMQAQLEAQGNVYALAINQAGIIRATGVSRDATGVVVLSAPNGAIRQAGTILAVNRDGSGGRLSVSGRDITTEISSIMTAAGSGVTTLAMGGQIEISAEKDAILDGRLDVSAGDGAKGGRLVVTGERVGLFGGKVDASGGTGGGEVLLGGDYQGLNPLVRNAKATVMSGDSEIFANATVAGDGGKVILWSDEYTGFYGDISANGGPVSGNGGFVETSSKDNLQAFGMVTASAENGDSGLWFLDPLNIAISSAASANVAGSPNFTPTATGANILAGPTASAGSISAVLSAGTSVTVSTGFAAGTEAGNITISSSIGKTAGGNATLTLNANGSIVIQSGGTISSTTGTLGLVMNAGVANGGDPSVVANSTVTIGDTIGLNGGVLTISNAGTGAISFNANVGGAATAAVATANITGGGAITQGSGAITVSGTTTLNGGTITLASSGNDFSTVVVIQGSNVTLVDGTALTLGAVTTTGALNVTSTTSTITQAAATSISVGGNLTISATGAISQANTTTSILTVNGATSVTTSSGSNISLNGISNNFVGQVSIVRGNNVAIVDSIGGLNLGPSTIGGTFSATSTGGNITDSGGIDVTGITTLNSSIHNIELNQSNNDFDTVVISAAQDVTLVDETDIIFGASVVSGDLNVTTGGDVTQTGALTITGSTTISADSGTANVVLSDVANDFSNPVDIAAGEITLSDLNDVTLTSTQAINFVDGTITGTLTVNGSAAVNFIGSTDFNPGGLVVTTPTGGINQTDFGTITVAGNTSLNAGAGNNISLQNNNDFQGVLSIGSAKDVTLNGTGGLGAILFGNSTINGTLDVTATGLITQQAATTISVNSTAAFTTGGAAITLTQANNFIGAVSLTNTGANNVQITDANALTLGTLSIGQNLTALANGALNLGQGTIGGSLSANSFNGALGVSGAITQTAGLTVTTTSSLTAGANAITLNNSLNNFTQAVTLSNSGNNNISLTDQNAIVLAASSVGTGTLTINAVGITQTGAITQAAGAGTATFSGGAGAITLTSANDFTGAVSLNNGGANNVQITDANALTLGTLSLGQNLTVISNGALNLGQGTIGGLLSATTSGNGAITQTGALTVTTTSSLTAGANAITLNNSLNDFTQAVTLSNSGNNNISLTDQNAIVLAASSVGTGTLTINAVGITQTGAITQTAGAGAATFNAGAGVITLTSANDFTGAVSLNNSGANNVQVTDANAISLGASSVGTGTLAVTGVGITQTGAITQAAGAGAATFNGGAGVITLTQANNFTGAVSLNNSGANNVAVTDANAIILGASSVGTGTLTINAVGITQTGAITQTAGAGAATFNAGAGVITLTSANDFTGAVSLNNSGANNVQVTDANAISLGASSVGTGTLAVTGVGITQTGAITQAAGAGAATFNGGAGVITLTSANNFTGAVSLNNSGANNVAVTDANAIILGTSSVGDGTLGVTAGGSISQTGAVVQAAGAGNVTLTVTTAGSDILMASAANDFSGTVLIGGTASNVRDFALRNINAGAGAVTGLGNATTTNLRDLTIIYNAAGYQVPTFTTVTSLRNISITAGGAITQAAGGIVQGVAGAPVSFTTGAFAITLTDTANNFLGAVSLTNTGANNVQITDANALTLGTLSIGQNLTALANGALNLGQGTIGGSLTANSFNTGAGANGAITQSGALTVTTTTSLTAGANAITLDNGLNDFVQAVGLSNSGNNNISLTDQNAIVLAASSVGTGTLTINAVGITQTGGITQAAGAGTATFNGGAGVITLTAANDFTGAVSLNNSGAFNIQLTDSNALQLGGVSMTASAAGTLSITAGGNITQAASTSITTGTGLVTVTGVNGGDVVLGNTGNTFNGALTLAPSVNPANRLNNVTVLDTTALEIQSGLTVGGDLVVTALGITQAGAITVAGSSTFNGGAGVITLTSANDFTGAVSLNNSGANNVAVTDANAIILGTSSVGTGTLAVTATGANSITQTGNITQVTAAGTATFTTGAGVITLTQNNNFTGSVSLNNSGNNAVSVTDINSIILGSSSVGLGGTGNLTVTTGAGLLSGGITQTGALTVTGATNLNPLVAATDIDLATQSNDLTGVVTVINPANVRDFKLRNVSASAAVPDVELMTNLRDLTLIFNNSGLTLTDALNSASARNVVLTAGGLIDYAATGNTTLSGTLTATSTGNGISQTSTGGWIVGGTTTLTAAATGDIELLSADNDFVGTLSISSAQNASIYGSGAMTVGATATSGGTILSAGGTMTLTGSHTTGNTFDMLFGSENGDLVLNTGATFTSRNITLGGVNLVNQAGASPFSNLGGGRTLVFTTSPSFNQPTSLNGGFSGFGQAYLQSPNISYPTVFTYTVNNSLPAGNLMVYSSGLPITDASASVLNENVELIAYKASVPVQGYSLPAIYSGQVRLGFKAASAAVQNSLGQTAPSHTPDSSGRLRVSGTKASPTTTPMAESAPAQPPVGRLKVSQIKPAAPKNEVGSTSTPGGKPMVRAGSVILRMSGEFYPFELAEVAIGSPKVSQNR